MISVGEEQIEELFVGEMGIKDVAIGSEIIHSRSGGYFYLELKTEEE